MTTDQRDQIAIVFDMTPSQLKAALWQIILGDDVRTALDKARCQPSHYKKREQKEFFKSSPFKQVLERGGLLKQKKELDK